MSRTEASKTDVTKLEAPAEITVYTLSWCVHCGRAKALLRRRGLAFSEIDGTGVPGFRQRVAERTGGFTVPQVLIDGEPIGGADRLAALDRHGVLNAIANNEQFPISREIRRVSPGSLTRWAIARVRGRTDVSAIRRTQVRIDRAGRVISTGGAPSSEAAAE